jgi:sigma-B regulation protein RsbU (phosphoserine phosphatase)
VASKQDLEKKIQELETELQRKDQDLKIYKRELAGANAELERLIMKVNDQLQQSVRIQKFLVPTEFPNIPGFDFSTKFSSSSVSGGDYFDIFEHFDKMRFGLFLSSASGYGMSALFLSVLVGLSQQIEDSKNNEPRAVLQQIFQEMREHTSSSDKAAIFYGVFNRRKYQMTYANVGQPLAIHFQSATGRIELLKGFSEALSPVSAPPELTQQTIELNPKDKLVFCSTGFLELSNDRGDMWGIDEILSVIKRNVTKSVHELRNEIFYQALKFSSKQPRDLTVIVTEVKDRIMKLA